MANGNLWTLEEISLLKTAYRKYSTLELQLLILDKCNSFRSLGSIEAKACFLGITRKTIQSKWLDLEIEYLKNNYKILTSLEISKNLDRSLNSVECKLNILGLCKYFKWTSINDKYLIDNYHIKSLSEISAYLGCSYNSCSSRAFKYKLNRSKTWTNSDIAYLKENCKKYDVSTLSKTLGFSIKSIHTKLNNLDIKYYKRSDKQKRYTEDEDNFIIENYENIGLDEISLKLNRSYSSVSHRFHIYLKKKN